LTPGSRPAALQVIRGSFVLGQTTRTSLRQRRNPGMFSASSLTRIASCLAVGALISLGLPVSQAQTIDVSLNVFYSNPSNLLSGGTWEVVAKSSTGGGEYFGIAGINVHLTDVLSTGFQVLAPRGTVNASDPAGFTVDLFNASGYRTLSAVQIALELEPGEEGAFYGVGTLTNGTPGAIGPTYTTLTGVQGSPWGTGDVFGDAAWNTAVKIASGLFAQDVTPGFTGARSGGVYDTLGTSTMVGDATSATVSAIVRTNFDPSGLPGDYNLDGVVDAADYVLFRKGLPATSYAEWRENFGESSGPGAGGSESSAVPEPASGMMLIFALICGSSARRQRTK
jgi:hypothetical protein